MRNYLNTPIDSSRLLFFKFFTCLMLIFEIINGIMIGKIHEYSVPQMHFSYLFTDFISPFPLWGIYLQYVVIIVCALLVLFGKYYRLSSTLLFLAFTHLFLSEMSEYINHAYLYSLMLFWLMVLPLGEKEVTPTHPRWMLWLVLFHVFIVYFFGGVAKLNSDWLHGTPMDIFLSQRENHLFEDFYSQKWAPLFFSWGGALFDLLIVFFFIIPKTRIPAFIMAALFHISNVFMFGLASFPWFCLLLSSLFFSMPWLKKMPFYQVNLQGKMEQFKLNKLGFSLIVLYLLVHITLPFRHFLYPHDASWSEEAHQFSWRMMLRTKSGEITFVGEKNNGKRFVINPYQYLTTRQFEKMKGHPDMILQFAHFVGKTYQDRGEAIKVFCYSQISLNHHAPQALIDSEVDLTQVKRSIYPYRFIKPFANDESKSRYLASP